MKELQKWIKSQSFDDQDNIEYIITGLVKGRKLQELYTLLDSDLETKTQYLKDSVGCTEEDIYNWIHKFQNDKLVKAYLPRG